MSSSANDFEKVLRAFIPKELIPPTWKFDENKKSVENIESLMKYGQLGIVKSAEQLNKDIGSYMCFPGAPQHFDMDPVVSPCPYDYASLKNTVYIYKKDLYRFFGSKDICPLKQWQRYEIEWALQECLQRMDFGSHHEMIVKPDIQQIARDGERVLKKLMEVLELSEDYEIVYDDLKKNMLDFLPVEIRDTISELFEEIIESYPTEKYSVELSQIVTWIGFILEAIEVYLRKESIHLPPFNSVPLTKPVVRLFSIDKNHFVMAHELLKTLKDHNIDVSGFEKEVNEMPKLSAFNFREVVQKVDKDVMKNLEFVKMEDFRLIFAQTPIPTCDGGYCTLAVDALRDVLMDMIVAKKVFQTIEDKDWIHIKKFFKSIESYFDQTRGVYYIDLKDGKTIKDLWENIYKTHLKRSSQKQMKTLKKTGFPVKHLKETLQFFELEKCFEGILEYAAPIYFKVTTDKESSTSHLHLTMMQCQVNSLVRKVPMLLKFMHKQGACDRLSIVGCELCDGKTLVDESAPITEEEPLANKTNPLSSEETKPEPEELNAETPEETADTIEKPSQKKKKSKKMKQPTPSEEVKPKESNACPKCERAGKFTREANEKLRLSKIEVKQLRKDLIRNQLENEEIKQKVMDKDERIRMLERLLEEKDDVIKEQEEKLKEQSAVIEDLRRVEEKEDSQTAFNEEAEKIEDVKSSLLAIKGILHTESPVTKCTEVVNRLIMNTRNEETKQMAGMEMRRFTKEATEYMDGVEDRLAMIQCNQFNAAEEIPELPEFPVFSQGFRSIYENIMKSRPPVICQQLLSLSEKVSDELEDTECVICLNNMDLEDETTKCGCCKRRYHNGCIQDWLKVKMTCPTCNSGLLDEEEFPVLV
ncbi:hypothetical protein GCK72_020877 [Caenorhabditis remanei]|uniref:RING-type domain-containing protein n=1 Tax=Caenorhabditis remanei TaxID=31234 RepID=A0A6A5GGG7_CAERE|nr:hypothetical protein GCK72_020877 [Caenorhabditis remanei]KAF1754317.1 hypothetical protein GCK72_020877 [Caenorhabditis remanei]